MNYIGSMPIPRIPIPRFPPKYPFNAAVIAALRAAQRRRKPKDKDKGGVPVEPDRPRNLSGGAAAELEFDD